MEIERKFLVTTPAWKTTSFSPVMRSNRPTSAQAGSPGT